MYLADSVKDEAKGNDIQQWKKQTCQVVETTIVRDLRTCLVLNTCTTRGVLPIFQGRFRCSKKLRVTRKNNFLRVSRVCRFWTLLQIVVEEEEEVWVTVEIIFNLWRGLCRGKNGEVDCNLYHQTVGEHWLVANNDPIVTVLCSNCHY